jgi:beta-N-acetylhexosaminidase
VSDSGIGLAIALDQEVGGVTQVGPPATVFPAAAIFGQLGEAELAEAAAAATGRELRAMGINVNFAPVADVNVDPSNRVIGERSFGSDPIRVSDLVVAQVSGFTSAGIAATAKHFPGHGDTSVDSHWSLPIVEHSRQEWDRLDRPPFQAAVGAGVPLIMTGHLAVPALDSSGLPATLSPQILGLLRQELGFEGVIVTDALWMAAVRNGRSDGQVASEALQAGTDVLLMPPNPAAAASAILAAVHSGSLPAEKLDQAVFRVLKLKERLGLLQPRMLVDVDAVPTVVGSEANRAILQRVKDACGASCR